MLRALPPTWVIAQLSWTIAEVSFGRRIRKRWKDHLGDVVTFVEMKPSLLNGDAGHAGEAPPGVLRCAWRGGAFALGYTACVGAAVWGAFAVWRLLVG